MKYSSFFLFLSLLCSSCTEQHSDWQRYQGQNGIAFYYKLWPISSDSSRARVDYGDELRFNVAVFRATGELITENKEVFLQVPIAMHRTVFDEPLVLLRQPGDSIRLGLLYKPEYMPELKPFATALQAGDSIELLYTLRSRRLHEDILAEKDSIYAAQRGYESVEAWQTERRELFALAQAMSDSLRAWTPVYYQGLHSQVLAGRGRRAPEPQLGDTLYLHYILQRADDAFVLDNSLKRGDRLPIVWGDTTQSLAATWQACWPALSKTGEAFFFLPPELAYGKQGRPPSVPANSWLKLYLLY